MRLVALWCLVSCLAFAQKPEKNPSDNLEVVPIDVVIPATVTAFEADGRWDLAYELRISNFADQGEYTITKVELLDPNGNAVFGFSGDELRKLTDAQSSVGTALKPHQFTTLFMWLSAGSESDLFPSLRHRVTVRASDTGKESSTDTPAAPIDRRPVVVIDSPLRGGDWVAMNGPSNNSVHRRSIIPVGGAAHLGQRFATDWARAYPDGSWFHGDEKQNKSYLAYGEKVYAVADGEVTEAKDGVAENTPGLTSRAMEITFANLAGNHVIMKIGDGLYAAYAHFQPGSVRVKVGDHVRKGQVLGLVGNTGNSTAPHLHFQICDQNSVVECEGVPYALSSFEVTGMWKPGGKPVKHGKELPLDGEVVNFGNE